MNPAELFKTPYISEQTKLLLSEHRTLSYDQIYKLLGYAERRERKAIVKAVGKMKAKGLVTVEKRVVTYVGGMVNKKKADKIWDAIRIKKVFTVPDLVLLTGASRSYIKNSLMNYRKSGHIIHDGWNMPGDRNKGQKLPVYRLVKDERCRPR